MRNDRIDDLIGMASVTEWKRTIEMQVSDGLSSLFWEFITDYEEMKRPIMGAMRSHLNWQSMIVRNLPDEN